MTDIWKLFIEFCKQEFTSGGPDPQIELITELAKETPLDVDKVWLAGCYGAHHCVPSAYAVWKTFPRPEDVIQSDLEDFLEEHWDALPVRPEMRSHRMVEKRAKCLADFAHYAVGQSWKHAEYYEVHWKDSIAKVKYYNRYMAIKYLEFLRRMVAPRLVLSDLRAKNAWSPRRALYMLWPEVEDLENEYDIRDEIVANVEIWFTRTIFKLSEALDFDVTSFQLQVLLCEFREALDGTYYPGASQDEELGYISLAAQDFDMSPIYDARQEIFDVEYLGEHNDWNDIRKEKYRTFTGA